MLKGRKILNYLCAPLLAPCQMDELVRAAPEEAYEPSFVARWAAAREQ